MTFEYQRSEHLINDHKITIARYAPTNGDPTTHVVEVVSSALETTRINFDHEGFKLFKAVMNQY